MKKQFKLTFVSNYMNHHQAPLSNELYRLLGAGYTFVQTEPVAEERVKMGWAEKTELPYVVYYQDNPEQTSKLIMDSDVVMFGGVDDENYVIPRLEAGKPVLRYSERLYKTGRWKFISPRGLIKKYHDHTRFRNKPVYLLCAGAFVAGDYNLIGAYPKKKFKWGYFPETKEYDIEKLVTYKRELTEQNGGQVSILWAGRFIDWKHPEMAIKLADHLKKTEYKFHLTMVGGGEMENQLHMMVQEKKLENEVTFAGYKKPEEVRTYMEDSEIFIFTSDRQEGWGAVLNEAMNSGCAVVAGNQIGAAPYLINDGVNGLLFSSKNQAELNCKVEKLLTSESSRKDMALQAYQTIVYSWNASEAALALLDICDSMMNGKKPLYRVEGPGGKA